MAEKVTDELYFYFLLRVFFNERILQYKFKKLRGLRRLRFYGYIRLVQKVVHFFSRNIRFAYPFAIRSAHLPIYVRVFID